MTTIKIYEFLAVLMFTAAVGWPSVVAWFYRHTSEEVRRFDLDDLRLIAFWFRLIGIILFLIAAVIVVYGYDSGWSKVAGVPFAILAVLCFAYLDPVLTDWRMARKLSRNG